jgi:ribosomal-protein-alanine N-acetyltransferase
MPNLSRLQILSADPIDAGRIVEIDPSVYRAGWTEAGIRDFLARPEARGGLAWDSSGVVGYYLARLVPPEAELLLITTLPDCRRRGIGTELLSHLLVEAQRAGCTRCFLEVRVSNEPAIRLYRRAGFRAAGVRKNYYSAPLEDAAVMVRGL